MYLDLSEVVALAVRPGRSNRRWIGGGKLCLVVNQWGLIVDWDGHTANVHDTVFQPMIRRVEHQMIVLGDQGFHAQEGDPANLTICPAKTWGDRMVLETVFSMLTQIRRFKQQTHRAWAYFKASLCFAVLVQWHGLQPDENGCIKLSMAEFSLETTSTIIYITVAATTPIRPLQP